MCLVCCIVNGVCQAELKYFSCHFFIKKIIENPAGLDANICVSTVTIICL